LLAVANIPGEIHDPAIVGVAEFRSVAYLQYKNVYKDELLRP
jgi:hypothetical protein